MQCCMESQGQHYIRFVPCNVVPGALRQHFTLLFPVQYYLEPLGQHRTRFYLCNSVPRVVSRQYRTIFFSAHCCREPLRQHGLKFLPVQCCLKSIKTILNWICCSAMLSRASCTTLHEVFTCAMLVHG